MVALPISAHILQTENITYNYTGKGKSLEKFIASGNCHFFFFFFKVIFIGFQKHVIHFLDTLYVQLMVHNNYRCQDNMCLVGRSKELEKKEEN
ncbi:hypothetical protein XELAEV_18009591mg [Xenopus laevis]|uniref:Uncharacterized protein n=1 Tax=Xenopus laevis TaxID=8355 RepID=A0A974DUS3_XENLA|nr:hypothetical protein XELAEV_18009591mg [Xenopus laevis]